MPKWFLGTIAYQQPIDESTVGTKNQEFVKAKAVTEDYLIDAVSYTDAESRLYQEVADNTPEFEITKLNRLKLADVFQHDDGSETWYKVKAMFIMDDEKTGKQKKVPSLMLVNAKTPKHAYERIETALKTALDPFEITDVNTTKILEIFNYDGDDDSITSSGNDGETAYKRLRKSLKRLGKEGTKVSVTGPDGESIPLN